MEPLEVQAPAPEASRSFFAQAALHRPESMQTDISIDDEGNREEKPRYIREYSCCSLVLFGCGNTIGAGIFAYTGLAAEYAGGPAAYLAYVGAGLVSFLTALVYAEFGAKYPKSGSSYLYSSIFQGELMAWVVAWNLNLRYGACAATVSRAWASYFMKFFELCGVTLPKVLNNYPCAGFDFSIIAPLFLLLCCLIQNRGSDASKKTNNLLTGLKITILFFIIGVSFCNFNYEKNFTPVVSPEKGFKGIMVATCKVFFAYVGFDFITTVSEETINPQKEIPRSIMGTISLASFLYIFTSFSVNGVENLTEVLKKNGNEYSTVLADVFSQNGMRWMAFVITIAALLGLAAVILSSVMGQARVTRAFAKDGLLWPIFGELDPKTNVPVKGAWITTIICALMAATLNLDTLATLCSVGNLLVYAVIDAAVIQMRLAEVPSKPGRRGQIVFIAPWSFLVLSIISAFVVAAEAPLWLNLILAALLFVNYVVLQVLIYQTNQIKKQDAAQGLLATVEAPKALFLCPLMPLLPCVGIWTNCVLSTVGSNGLTWAIFAAFEFVGLLFYACYGYKHSKLRKRIDRHEAAKLKAADGEQEE